MGNESIKKVQLKKIFAWPFWIWVIIAVTLSITILMTPSHREVLSSIIIASFAVLPARSWAYRLSVWLVDYVSSNNTDVRDKLNPHATYNRLLKPTERVENPGFYRALWFLTFIVSLVIALLWMVFKGTSFNIVYAWLRSIEFLVTGKYSPLRILLLLLLKTSYICSIVAFIGQILKAKMYDENGHFDRVKGTLKILGMLAMYLVNIFGSAGLLRFSGPMIWSNFLYKMVLLGIYLGLFFVLRYIIKKRKTK